MAFTPENDLEKALVRAVQEPSAAPDFYRLLLESQLLVMGTAEGQESATQQFSVAPGANLKLEIGEADGRKFLPVFSSVTRMQAYVKQESRYLALNGRDLLETTRGAPVVLNPGSEYGKDLAPDEVARLLDPSLTHKSEKVSIGEAVYPAALVDALVELFRSQAEVATAWMIQVTFADRAREPHPLVGIETGGDMAALMAQIERTAQQAVPGMVFDVQRVDRKNPTGMADALLQTPPFYSRTVPGRLIN
jgi:type III secretion system (T3SS) SseB-like protein